MVSSRHRAQLGMLSAAIVLVTSLSILIQGRESLRGQPRAPERFVVAKEIPDQQVVLSGAMLRP